MQLRAADAFELPKARSRVHLCEIDSLERFTGGLHRDDAGGDLISCPLINRSDKSVEDDACQCGSLIGFGEFIAGS